jgi:nucleoside-diphosphate-sugar epimerase
MNTLVIGGTGQLGHFICKHLFSRGHKITAVGIGDPPEDGFLPAGTTVVSLNVDESSVEDLCSLVRGHDAIVLGSGADGRNMFDAPAINGFRKANVYSTQRLIEAMQKEGVKNLVILGSYYTAMHLDFPAVDFPGKSPYVRSRLEQIEASFTTAGTDINVSIIELPYIFGAAPNRGTLWGFYIDTIMSNPDIIHVHGGGTACITMNQAGLATANACELNTGHRCFPIGNENLSYVQIFELFCTALGQKRVIKAMPSAFFLEQASQQKEAIQKMGKESAYDPVGFLDIEAESLYIDPKPSMDALGFQHEDISKAIAESVEATLTHQGDGPGTR